MTSPAIDQRLPRHPAAAGPLTGGTQSARRPARRRGPHPAVQWPERLADGCDFEEGRGVVADVGLPDRLEQLVCGGADNADTKGNCGCEREAAPDADARVGGPAACAVQPLRRACPFKFLATFLAAQCKRKHHERARLPRLGGVVQHRARGQCRRGRGLEYPPPPPPPPPPLCSLPPPPLPHRITPERQRARRAATTLTAT
ncbi:hypothetical protein C8F04DRAFT_259461 [Mycena alexandri]|uniref:Uncharacterized protein n=1 Tax=Mycena alexandri TaxID=1745969 RepID=A0AAD6S7G9_9AGAR|nr:hypothetical protein C8F04DRAFT_259461 [Mycena alexandri]